jgi:hypothetical protein
MYLRALRCILAASLVPACQRGDSGVETTVPAPPKEASQVQDSGPFRTGIEDRQVQLRIALREHLLNMPIGRQFKSYVSESRPPSATHSEANALARRVFSDPRLIMPRIDALRVLVNELFTSGEPPPYEQLEKVQWLHEQLESQRVAMERGVLSWMPSLREAIPYLIAVAFFSGSRQLRLKILAVSRKFYDFITRKSQEAVSLGKADRFLGNRFFRDYSPQMAYSIFMRSAMAYMILDAMRGMGGTKESSEISDPFDLSSKAYLLQLSDL